MKIHDYLGQQLEVNWKDDETLKWHINSTHMPNFKSKYFNLKFHVEKIIMIRILKILLSTYKEIHGRVIIDN